MIVFEARQGYESPLQILPIGRQYCCFSSTAQAYVSHGSAGISDRRILIMFVEFFERCFYVIVHGKVRKQRGNDAILRYIFHSSAKIVNLSKTIFDSM